MYPIRGGEGGQERGGADGEDDRQGDDDHEHCEQEDDRQEDDESEHDDDKIQMVVVKDESTGCVSAHVCEAKDAGDRWVVDRICDDIGLWGHTELIIKGDGEPALVQVGQVEPQNSASEPACIQSTSKRSG